MNCSINTDLTLWCLNLTCNNWISMLLSMKVLMRGPTSIQASFSRWRICRSSNVLFTLDKHKHQTAIRNATLPLEEWFVIDSLYLDHDLSCNRSVWCVQEFSNKERFDFTPHNSRLRVFLQALNQIFTERSCDEMRKKKVVKFVFFFTNSMCSISQKKNRYETHLSFLISCN